MDISKKIREKRNKVIKKCQKHGKTLFYEYQQKAKKKLSYSCIKCNHEYVDNARKNLKKMAILYCGGSCKKCKYKKCISALEFHHLDPSKKVFNLGKNGHTRSWDRIKKELDKCVLLCSNCHREEHATLDNLDFKLKTSKCLYCQSEYPHNKNFCNNTCRSKFAKKTDIELFKSAQIALESSHSYGQAAKKIKTTKKIIINNIKKHNILLYHVFKLHYKKRKKLKINKVNKIRTKNKIIDIDQIEKLLPLYNYNFSKVAIQIKCSGTAIQKKLKKERPELFLKIQKEKHPYLIQKCKICNKKFKQHASKLIYCSKNCSITGQQSNYKKFIKQILELRKQGLNKSNIAKKINIGRKSVESYIKKYYQSK